MTDKVVYDTKAFEAAHRRFLTDPKTVTDDDLALFELVFPSFAERARAMRAGFVNAQTAEDRTLGKEPIRAEVFYRLDCELSRADSRHPSLQRTAGAGSD